MELILISIAVGIAIGLIVVSVLKSQLKTVEHQSGAGSYVVTEGFELRIRTDTYLYQNTTRIPRTKPKK